MKTKAESKGACMCRLLKMFSLYIPATVVYKEMLGLITIADTVVYSFNVLMV